MKAILVINVPDDFLADPSDAYRLRIGGDAKVYYERQGENRCSIIGDTRNIKPIPQPKGYIDAIEWHLTKKDSAMFTDGWNACLDEIMGDTK